MCDDRITSRNIKAIIYLFIVMDERQMLEEKK